MSKKTSSAANAFGSGESLVGMKHKGHEIVSASRRCIHLDNGEQVKREGSRVEHEEFTSSSEDDSYAYMTDDL